MIDATDITDRTNSRTAFPLRAILTVLVVVVPVLVLFRLRRTPHTPEAALPIDPVIEPPTVPGATEPESLWDVEPTNLQELGAILLKEMQRIRFTETQRRALKILLALLVVSLPLLMLVGLPRIVHGTSLADYVPNWSDEIYYWRQSLSFQHVGFNSGYFTYGEQIARLGNYYSWGIFIPIFQGTIGKIFGWSLVSIPLINAILLGGALAVFVWVTKPDIERLLWLMLGLLAFVPFVMYHITSMIEVMLDAFAVLIATSFYALMRTRSPTRVQGALALLVIMAASLMRPAMGLFFIPLCLLWQRRNSVFTIGAALVVGAALWVTGWVAYWLTAAPAYRPVTAVFEALTSDPGRALQIAIDNSNRNLSLITHGEPPEIFLRLQFLVAIPGIAVMTLLRRWRVMQRLTLPVPAVEAALHLYNLGMIFLFSILFYEFISWRDFRGMAPHLLFSVILFVAFRRRFWLAAFVLSALLFLPQTQQYYRDWSGAYLSPQRHAAYDEWQAKLADVLVYQPDAPSPWCNTVLHLGYYFNDPVPLLALPPEMAISFVLDAGALGVPAKSLYFLIDHDSYANHPDRFPHIEPLLEVPGGVLYRNLDADC